MGQFFPKSIRSSIISRDSNRHDVLASSLEETLRAQSGLENLLPALQIGVELIGSELRLRTQEHRLGLPETLHCHEEVLI